MLSVDGLVLLLVQANVLEAVLDKDSKIHQEAVGITLRLEGLKHDLNSEELESLINRVVVLVVQGEQSDICSFLAVHVIERRVEGLAGFLYREICVRDENYLLP